MDTFFQWSYENPKEAARNIAGHMCFDPNMVKK